MYLVCTKKCSNLIRLRPKQTFWGASSHTPRTSSFSLRILRWAPRLKIIALNRFLPLFLGNVSPHSIHTRERIHVQNCKPISNFCSGTDLLLIKLFISERLLRIKTIKSRKLWKKKNGSVICRNPTFLCHKCRRRLVKIIIAIRRNLKNTNKGNCMRGKNTHANSPGTAARVFNFAEQKAKEVFKWKANDKRITLTKRPTDLSFCIKMLISCAHFRWCVVGLYLQRSQNLRLIKFLLIRWFSLPACDW